MNFITLPSGCLLNPFYVRTAYPRDNGIRIVLNDSTYADELMSLMDFQNLLRGPAQTPVIEPIINIDKLRTGCGVQFTYKNTVKMGVFGGFRTEETRDAACLRFRSHGDIYEMWTDDLIVEKLQ
jgi:hypothetical protein